MSWAQAALSHDDWVVRQNATHVLADLDNDQAVPLLARAGRFTAEVRRSAATALGQKNLRAALSALRIALNDADPEVRQAGLRAMVNIPASMAALGLAPPAMRRAPVCSSSPKTARPKKDHRQRDLGPSG